MFPVSKILLLGSYNFLVYNILSFPFTIRLKLPTRTDTLSRQVLSNTRTYLYYMCYRFTINQTRVAQLGAPPALSRQAQAQNAS